MQEALASEDVYLNNCPSRALLARIADKWTALIVGILEEGAPRRFSDVRRAIGGISQKMLTQTLREMERDGLVRRDAYPEIPPRVEYSLTPLGFTLREPLHALAAWSQEHIVEVREAQAHFDATGIARAAAARGSRSLPSVRASETPAGDAV